MAKKTVKFEKDEKKSLIIAIIVCAIVVIAVVLSLLVIRHKRVKKDSQMTVVDTQETADDEMSSSIGYYLVKTQEELEHALTDPETREILVQTEEEMKFVIPEGNYSDIGITVDSPYAEFENQGVFSFITISQIAANTWTEKANGNTFSIDSSASHFIIPQGYQTTRIENNQASSTLALEVYGSLDMLTLSSSAGIVSVQDDNTVGQIVVVEYVSLNLSGNTSTPVDIALGSDADGTILKTNIPITVSSYATLTADFMEGAEDSSISIKNVNKKMTVSNHTAKEIILTDPEGAESQIEAGKEGFVFETQSTQSPQTQSTSSTSASSSNHSSGSSSSGSRTQSTSSSGSTSGSAGSSSGSAVSSTSETSASIETNKKDTTTNKDDPTKKENTYTEEEINKLVNDKLEQKIDEVIKNTIDNYIASQPVPEIVGFESGNKICVGAYGRLLSETEVINSLPTEIYGLSSQGFVIPFPVLGWTNYDGYSITSEPGEYRFKALLGTPPLNCTMKAETEAFAYVYVNSFENLSYQDDYSRQIEVQEYEAARLEENGIASYYVLTNKSDKVAFVRLFYYYFNEDGDYLNAETSVWHGRYIQPGESWIAARLEPATPYETYTVKVEAEETDKEVYDIAIDEHTVSVSEDEENRIVNVEIKNNTKKQITPITVTYFFFDSDKKLIGTDSHTTGEKYVQYGVNELGQQVEIPIEIPNVSEPESISSMKFGIPIGTRYMSYNVSGGYQEPKKEEKTDNLQENE